MQVQIVERSFNSRRKMMKAVSKEDEERLKGHLPFFSVDTQEEVDAVINLALERGEFWRQADGSIIEMTLLYEQSLENLNQAGENLAALHKELFDES